MTKYLVRIAEVRRFTGSLIVEAESADAIDRAFDEFDSALFEAVPWQYDKSYVDDDPEITITGVPGADSADLYVVDETFVPAKFADVVRRVVEASDTLCLDNEEDRKTLVDSMMQAWGGA